MHRFNIMLDIFKPYESYYKTLLFNFRNYPEGVHREMLNMNSLQNLHNDINKLNNPIYNEFLIYLQSVCDELIYITENNIQFDNLRELFNHCSYSAKNTCYGLIYIPNDEYEKLLECIDKFVSVYIKTVLKHI